MGRDLRRSDSKRALSRETLVGFATGFALLLFLGFAILYSGSTLGETLVAIGTLALAGATAWLGAQTFEVSQRTGELSSTTREELDLLREQSTAATVQAATMRDQLQELRESRFAEFLPVLRWQTPHAWLQASGAAWTLGVQVYLTNEGPGPARIREARVETDTREDFAIRELAIPSTLPSGERLILVAFRKTEVLERRARLMTINIRYGDLLGEFEYETSAKIRALFEEPGISASFVDSDERSALERRLPREHRGATSE